MTTKTIDDVKQEIEAIDAQIGSTSLTQEQRETLQMQLNSLRKHLSRMTVAEAADPVRTHDADGLVLPEFQQQFEHGCEHVTKQTYADGVVRCAHCGVVIKEASQQ